MSQEPNSVTAYTSHEDILDAIEHTTRDHHLAWHLDIGRLLLDAFWDGDVHAYRDRNPHKDQRFADFCAQHAEDLERFGLSETTARACIRGFAVYRALPESVRGSLFFRHVTELAPVGDPTARARLAVAVVQQNWSVRRLRIAVQSLRAGDDLDAVVDPAAPPPVASADAPLPPGRLISRAERWAEELDGWGAQWQAVQPQRLPRKQRERLQAAVAQARARLERLAAALGEV